jgi:hypothetical protein
VSSFFPITKWLGLYTRAGRNQRPVGAMDNMSNLVLNDKMNKLTPRPGYVVDTASFTSADGVAMTGVNQLFTKSMTQPASHNVSLLLGTDGSANKWFFLSPWYNAAGNQQTSSFVKIGETTTTTINGSPSGATFVLTAGSATDDYYKGWLIYNTTRTAYAHVLGYVGGTKTITVRGSGELTSWASTDSVTLYRHFCDDRTFAPTYNAMPTDTPAACESIGTGLVMSGGQGSTAGLAGIWTGYVDHAYGADYSSGTYKYAYKGTYASELPLTFGAGFAPQNVASYSSTGNGLNSSARWFVGYIAEDDYGQRSTLQKSATDYLDCGADQGVQFSINWASARFNFRIRYLTVFIGYTFDKTKTTLDWSQYNYITKIDLTASGIWTGGTTTLTSKTFTYDIRDWNTRGTDLVSYLGTTSYSSATCSFSSAKMVGNRLIVGNLYDYTASAIKAEYIRFSGFGSGLSQYTLLCDNPLYGEQKVAPDGGNPIMALENFQNTLVVFKKNSFYTVGISSDSTTWTLTTQSQTVGTDAPKSVINMGSGIIFAKSVDDVFFWQGGLPQGLTDQWQKTYRAFATNVNNRYGMFNPANKTYYLTCDQSDATVVHMIHFNQMIDDKHYVWTRHQLAHSIQAISIRPNGDLFFTNGSTLYKFSDTATDDAGTAIAPYFDTGDYVIDENQALRLIGWYVRQTQSGTVTADLALKIYVDGSVVTNQTSLTKTKVRLHGFVPTTTPLGTRFRMEYNTGSPRVTLGTAFSIEEVGFEYELLPYVGDATLSL